MGRSQRIDNLISKYIHLSTLKIIVTPQLFGKAKLFLSTLRLLLHAVTIYKLLLLTLDSTNVIPLPDIDSLDYLPVPLSTNNTKNF